MKVNKATYEKIIAQDIELLKDIPDFNLEKKHIIAVLKDSVKQYYPNTSLLEWQFYNDLVATGGGFYDHSEVWNWIEKNILNKIPYNS